MTWRPPLLAEAVALAAEVTRSEAHEFLRRDRLETLDAAIEPSGPWRADEDDPKAGFARRLATMADRIVRSGVIPDASRVAEALVTETVKRSGAVWTLDGLSTSLFLQAWSRAIGPLPTLVDWFCEHLKIPETWRRTPPDWARQLARHKSDAPLRCEWVLDHRGDIRYPAIYVAGPFAHLEPGSQLHVELVRDEVARGLDAALNWLPLACPVRLLHPSRLLANDSTARSDEEWLKLSRHWLSGEADGLVLSDVARRAPGFGAGVEAALYTAGSGPTLILLDAECAGHSRFEQGLAGEIRGDVRTLSDPEDLCPTVADWAARTFEDLQAAWRRRRNARLLNHAQHQALCVRIQRSSPSQLRLALELSGLSLDRLTEAVDSIDSMATIPWNQLETAMRVLRPVARQRRPRRPRASNRPALLLAGKRQGWPADRIAFLERAAAQALRTAGAENRLALETPEDWIALDERLRRAR
jgi:hypothetical protein